jgi:hypothetical protein
MEKGHSASDVPGYIYTFEIRGSSFILRLLLKYIVVISQTPRPPKSSILKLAVQSTLSNESTSGVNNAVPKNRFYVVGGPGRSCMTIHQPIRV